jgi:hypothetical protein
MIQLVGSRLSNILKALDDFFAYGKENNINTYIINGDLFDNDKVIILLH